MACNPVGGGERIETLWEEKKGGMNKMGVMAGSSGNREKTKKGGKERKGRNPMTHVWGNEEVKKKSMSLTTNGERKK